MPYIDPTIIEQVKAIDLLTYLRDNEPGELVKLSDNAYCTRTHDSLKISNGKWYWWSRGFGGKSALDYLVKVRDMRFLEAVDLLMRRNYIPLPPPQRTKPEAPKKRIFRLSQKSADFTENDYSIARLDKLSRNEEIQKKLGNSIWDLIVCDEAHKMSDTYFGNEAKYTKRFQLGRLLGEITENLLLLTATPHNGKPEVFQLFMSLIDRDRFEGAKRNSSQPIDVSDVMRRLVKEELLKFDGRPLSPSA